MWPENQKADTRTSFLPKKRSYKGDFPKIQFRDRMGQS